MNTERVKPALRFYQAALISLPGALLAMLILGPPLITLISLPLYASGLQNAGFIAFSGILFLFWLLNTLRIYLPLAYTTYILTPDGIIIRRRFIILTETSIPYTKITNITIRQNIFERLFNLGSIILDTAGTAGQEGVLVYLKDFETLAGIIKSRIGKTEG